MRRREFILKSAGLLGASLVLARCGGGDSGNNSPSPTTPTPNPSCSNGGGITYKNPGHGHTTINLTVAEINNAVPGNYTLMGGSHSHSFNLTATDFANLKNAQIVSKTDNEGDGHIIDIVCI